MDVTILVPWGREDVTALLYRSAEVLSEDAREDGTLVHARVGARVRHGGAVPSGAGRGTFRAGPRRRLTSAPPIARLG